MHIFNHSDSTSTDTKTITIEDLLSDVDNPAALILFNDEVNTFDHVINSLVEICKLNSMQAEQLAMLVHFKGKAVVKKGNIEALNEMCSSLCDRGLTAEVKN